MPAVSSVSAVAVIPQTRMKLSSSQPGSFALETRATETVLVPITEVRSRLLRKRHLHAPTSGDCCAALEVVPAALAGGRVFPAERDVTERAAQKRHQFESISRAVIGHTVASSLEST